MDRAPHGPDECLVQKLLDRNIYDANSLSTTQRVTLPTGLLPCATSSSWLHAGTPYPAKGCADLRSAAQERDKIRTRAMQALDTPQLALRKLIHEPTPQPRNVAAFLDQLVGGDRVVAVRSLGPRTLRVLWDLVDGYADMTLADLVPRTTPPYEPVVHYGRNSLPMFTMFEKRFYRMGDGSAIGGANFQTFSPLTGPGYFVARKEDGVPEVLIDYQTLPKDKPSDWPELRDNDSGIAKLVYGSMVDAVRRVSEHVSIGAASKNGQQINAYFVLCREQQLAQATTPLMAAAPQA